MNGWYKLQRIIYYLAKSCHEQRRTVTGAAEENMGLRKQCVSGRHVSMSDVEGDDSIEKKSLVSPRR